MRGEEEEEEDLRTVEGRTWRVVPGQTLHVHPLPAHTLRHRLDLSWWSCLSCFVLDRCIDGLFPSSLRFDPPKK